MTGKVSAWADTEPILARVGPVLVAIVGYLLARGIVTADTYDLVVALASAVIGGGAISGARSASVSRASLREPKAGEGD